MSSAQSNSSSTVDEFQKPESKCQDSKSFELEKKKAKNKKKKQSRKKSAKAKKREEAKIINEDDMEEYEDDETIAKLRSTLDPRWRKVKSLQDLSNLNIEFFEGKLTTTPHGYKINRSTKKLIPSLIEISKLGVFVVHCHGGWTIKEQYVHSASLDGISIINSYIDRESCAFVSFFVSHEMAEILSKKLSERKDVTYIEHDLKNKRYNGNFKDYFDSSWVIRYRIYKNKASKGLWTISDRANMIMLPTDYLKDFPNLHVVTAILETHVLFRVFTNEANEIDFIKELHKLLSN